MSSRTPDNGRESPRGPEGIWHPAHEWLEDDELDPDYHPALEPSQDDGAWEDDTLNDQQMRSEGASGRTEIYVLKILYKWTNRFPVIGYNHINLENIQIELTADDSESEDTGNLNEGRTRSTLCWKFSKGISTISHKLQYRLPDYSSYLHPVAYNISSKPMVGQALWKKSKTRWKMKKMIL